MEFWGSWFLSLHWAYRVDLLNNHCCEHFVTERQGKESIILVESRVSFLCIRGLSIFRPREKWQSNRTQASCITSPLWEARYMRTAGSITCLGSGQEGGMLNEYTATWAKGRKSSHCVINKNACVIFAYVTWTQIHVGGKRLDSGRTDQYIPTGT